MKPRARSVAMIWMAAMLAALLGPAAATSAASLPTSAVVTIVEPTEVVIHRTDAPIPGGWTVAGPQAEAVQVSLQWRTLDGQPVVPDASRDPEDQRPLVLTLVVCRE